VLQSINNLFLFLFPFFIINFYPIDGRFLRVGFIHDHYKVKKCDLKPQYYSIFEFMESQIPKRFCESKTEAPKSNPFKKKTTKAKKKEKEIFINYIN
jgi:hypothetical protein